VATLAGKLASRPVPDILLASDAASIHDDIRSVLEGGDVTVRGVNAGADIRGAVQDRLPELVILDLQIGNMGGMATCLDLRLEEGAGRVARHVPVLMLLDRRADVFLARRSDAEGWILKPVDPIRLRRAVRALLAGGRYEDDSYRPEPVLVTLPSGTMPDDGK
jgi:DNA-binding response OmpR family regulator